MKKLVTMTIYFRNNRYMLADSTKIHFDTVEEAEHYAAKLKKEYTNIQRITIK